MAAVFIMPEITAVSITPNPVNANTAFTITVSVTERSVEVEQPVVYCGTITSGEDGI